MAERSFFWAGTSTGDAALTGGYGAPYSDDVFSDFFNVMLNFDRRYSGVIFTMDTRFGGMFGLTASGSTLTVGTGAALVDGKLYTMDASQNFSLSSSGTYQIVLIKNFSAQTVRMACRAGSTVTQTDGTTWELELYRISFTSPSTTTWVDKRQYISTADRFLIGSYEIDATAGHDDTTARPTFSLNTSWPFRRLRLEWDGATYTDTDVNAVYGFQFLVFNGDNVSGNYNNTYQIRFATSGLTYFTGNSAMAQVGITGANNIYGGGYCDIIAWNTAGTPKIVMGHGYSRGDYSSADTGPVWADFWAAWKSNSKISSIEIWPAVTASTSLFLYGRWYLYGLL